MKFIKNPPFTSTWLQGKVEAPYTKLLATFGEPSKFSEAEGDGKVSIEWSLRFADGTPATIYDWKNYSSPEALIEANHSNWHIGGTTRRAVELVLETLNKGA